MPPTVAPIIQVLNRRWGECASLADAQDALFRAAVVIGLTPTNFGAVADADIVSIQAQQYTELVDIAEERGLETILNNLDKTTLVSAGISTDPEKLRIKYNTRWEFKRGFIERAYGVGLPTLQVGKVSFNFQEQFDPNNPPTET